MAAPVKRGDTWRIQISVAGVRESESFPTKAKAVVWAEQRRTELRTQKFTGITRGKTCREAFDRYREEVSPTKRGERWEGMRLKVFDDAFGHLALLDLTPDVIGKWRDERLQGVPERKAVTGSTVNRDLNLLSNVLTIARREWKWIAASPTKDVRRPKESAARDRRIKEDEIALLCEMLGFSECKTETTSAIVAVAFLFAIETAMRAGEICALQPEWTTGAVVHLPASVVKNGVKRDVPLSKRAIQLLGFLPKDRLFAITTKSLDALFRKAKVRAGIVDLHFHDSRHEAITRLARKLDVLALARMVGHRDIRQLSVYYNESAADIAQRLG